MKFFLTILIITGHFYGFTQEIPSVGYDSLGAAYRSQGKMTEAIWAFGKAKETALNEEAWGSYAKAAHQQGWCYFYIAEFDSADWMLKEVLERLDTILQADIERANIYYCLSAVSARKTKNSKAIDYAQKAVDIALYSSEHKAELAKFYNALGIGYSNKFDFQKALESQFLSVELKKEIWGDRSNEVAKSYNNIGIIYREMDELEKALDYYNRSLDIKIEQVGPEDLGVAATYNNMAILYQDLENLDKSIELLLKALDIERSVFGENSYPLADKYGILATAYKNKGMYEKALEYNDKCFSIWRKVFSENHDLYARALRSNADIYTDMGDYPAAYNYYHRSLMEMLGKFGENEKIPVPDKTLLVEKMDVLFTLSNYAKATWNNYKDSGDMGLLDKAITLYERSSELVDMLRIGYKEEVSRLALQDNAADIYEGAINASFELYRKTGNETFIDKAFNFSEKNKSAVLQSFIIENQALEYSGIPDSILEEEENLKSSLRSIEEEVQSMKGKAGQELLNKQYEAKKEYEKFVARLEIDFPKYHQLKYAIEQASLKEVKQYAGDKNCGFIEFFWGKDWIYIFKIFPSENSLSRIPNTDSLNNLITKYKTLLSDANIAIEKEMDIDAFNEIIILGHRIYREILEQKIGPGISSLIIVPDGLFYTIPVELMITNLVNLIVPDYSDIPFLFKKTPIRYGYSASQFIVDKKRAKPSYQLAAFAPVYDGQVSLAYNSRDNLSTLQYAYQEAKNIADTYNGQFYGGAELNKNTFKENAPNYDILHLAMHAYTDDNNPMYSGMVFSNDEILHAYELYNMELNADLVVLSACNTGAGKTIKGEGVMSLARAFRHAGVDNIVMSQWQADDEATESIMKLFYGHLASGLPKHFALNKAKIDYLTENSRKVHPYFWGAFILVGDDAPVSLNLAFNVKDYIIIGIMLILVLTISWSLIRFLR